MSMVNNELAVIFLLISNQTMFLYLLIWYITCHLSFSEIPAELANFANLPNLPNHKNTKCMVPKLSPILELVVVLLA